MSRLRVRRPAALGVALALLVLVGLRLLGLSFYRVEGSSMAPFAMSGDLLIIGAGGVQPERGDVVLVDALGSSYLMKRIIGLPGETVEIRDGRVFIDGSEIAEPYLPEGVVTSPEGDHDGLWRLGPREIFVLGDNRGHSQDSRIFGPLDIERLKGEPFFRYWPLDRAGGIGGEDDRGS